MSRPGRVQLLADRVKGRKVVRQSRTRPTKAKLQSANLKRPALDASGQTYLSAAEACDYVRSPTLRAFYAWIERQRIQKFHRGRRLLFLRRDLDEAVQTETREEPRQA